ncbi:MAG: HAD family phosphatase [Lachnospiraceae bacterium]|nr:HAD family phosphatase [Lachnospiraceae bacterium]
MKADIRLITADLDGTLLDSKKRFTLRTINAIRRAAENGVVFVPATGRSIRLVPRDIIGSDFVWNVITLNGARIIDLLHQEDIAVNVLDNRTALDIMEFMDGLPVIYECCFDDLNQMGAAHKAKIADYTVDEETYQMLLKERAQVPDLKQAVRDWGGPVQKVQFYYPDPSMKPYYLELMKKAFPEISVVSSIVNNVEMTHKKANKGDALLTVCNYLDIDPARAMAFGDDLNDLGMIRAAGIGVAMGNAYEAVKKEADVIAPTCDEEGVARVIEELCL